MNIIEKLNWRYATKEFDTNKKVSVENINRLLEAINLSASSIGLQQFRIVVIEDQELKDRLFGASMNQKQIKTASHIFVFACINNLDKAYIEKHVDRLAKARNIPASKAAEMKTNYAKWVGAIPKEQKSNWEEKQAYLALGNLLTVAAVEGIDTCPIEGFNNLEYDKILGLKEKELRSVVVCPIGYRSENDAFQHLKKVRLPLEDLVVTPNSYHLMENNFS